MFHRIIFLLVLIAVPVVFSRTWTSRTWSTLFFFPLPLFCTTTTLFWKTKTSNFLAAHYFYGGIVECAYPIFCFLCCVQVRFYFSRPLMFTLLAASISHFLTAALNLYVFLPTKFVSFVLSITRSSSFSVIHVGVNIKNNAENTRLCCCFFLSKSPGSHVISVEIKPWVAFGLLYLLIELFYIGMPVVRTDDRCTVTWLPNFLGWVDYHISLAMGLR